MFDSSKDTKALDHLFNKAGLSYDLLFAITEKMSFPILSDPEDTEQKAIIIHHWASTAAILAWAIADQWSNELERRVASTPLQKGS